MSKFKPGQRVILKAEHSTSECFWSKTAVLQENFNQTKWHLIFDDLKFERFKYNSDESAMLPLEDGNDILKGML